MIINKWFASIRKFLFGIAILSILLAGAPAAYAQENASETLAAANVSLSTDLSSFTAADAVIVHVTISNTAIDPIRILKWLTPVNGVEESLFEITRDGQPITYRGMIAKRATPTASDYLTLAAGESLTRDVDLSAYYDLSVSGTYKVKYNVASADLDDAPNTGSLVSNIITLLIEGHSAPATLDVVAETVTGSNGFSSSCDAGRQTNLINARDGASTYLSNAFSFFSSNTYGARYSYWFGPYDAARYITVKNHYTALQSAIDTAAMSFNCDCTDSGIYAYVYPDSPYDVYLCGAFWSAPTTGTDSKAGTLIHETSHFTIVSGTDDYAYGQSAAHALAGSNPAHAVMNADSHEYFAENNPALGESGTIFISNGAYDGYVAESSETSGVGGTINAGAPTIYFGDNTANKQYRGVLSFDTSSLPDTATITSVTLYFKHAGVSGTLPFDTHGNLLVDVRTGAFSANPLLETLDFKALASKNNVFFFNSTKVNNWYSKSLGAASYQYISLTDVTQFRLRFNKDDDNDFVTDLLKIYSGNSSAANRPQLVIEYTIP